MLYLIKCQYNVCYYRIRSIVTGSYRDPSLFYAASLFVARTSNFLTYLYKYCNKIVINISAYTVINRDCQMLGVKRSDRELLSKLVNYEIISYCFGNNICDSLKRPIRVLNP